ncbi:hypothetical protein FC756_12410 [Lysinibacillus mangiferihumi]|uniref:DUF2019 domain-containing protein n=1 Tax=Lysinibacillus mangiferihumi TaxID=1130819 RepID=A0A4U2Z2X9_9BACI|nr:hypothetical protein [Lysinibacillus mangiferihumi]TKI67682.1 hypothetical protein FC756_12410 [Lysinibacillus mangiferihumi]
MQDEKILIETFIKHALIAEQTQMTGDYKRGNKSNKALLAILEQLKQSSELATAVLDELFLHENPFVLYVCSIYAIIVDYRRAEALKMLEKIAGIEQNMTSFEASIVLEQYESGELFKLYGVNK